MKKTNKHLHNKIVFLSSLIFVLSISVGCGKPARKEIYTEKLLIKGKVGSGDGELLWKKLEDAITYGPTSYAIDSNGSIWIVDVLNNRIQGFDSTGHYLFQFVPEDPRNIHDITISKDLIYILYYKPKILIYNLQGQLLRELTIGKEGYKGGLIRVDEKGYIFIEHPDIDDYVIKLYLPKENIVKEENVVKGLFDLDYWVETEGNYYVRVWRSGLVGRREPYLCNMEGDSILCIKKYKGFTVIGMDGEKNIYAITERGEDYYNFLKISPNGKILTEFNMRSGFCGPECHSHIVDKKGNVYVLDGDVDKFFLWKYELTKR